MRILGETNLLLAILTWMRRFLRDQRNDSLLYLLKSHYPWLKVWCTGLYLLVSHFIFYLMSEIMNLPFNFPTLFLESQHNVKRLSTLIKNKSFNKIKHYTEPIHWCVSKILKFCRPPFWIVIVTFFTLIHEDQQFFFRLSIHYDKNIRFDQMNFI